MKKKKSELLQIMIFLIVAVAQVFLAARYYSRNDVIGMIIFGIVAVLAGIAAVGHFLEWKKL